MPTQLWILLVAALLISMVNLNTDGRVYGVQTNPGCARSFVTAIIVALLLVCFPAWRHGLMVLGIPNLWSWIVAGVGSFAVLGLTMLWREILGDGPGLVEVGMLAVCAACFYGYAWVAFGQPAP